MNESFAYPTCTLGSLYPHCSRTAETLRSIDLFYRSNDEDAASLLQQVSGSPLAAMVEAGDSLLVEAEKALAGTADHSAGDAIIAVIAQYRSIGGILNAHPLSTSEKVGIVDEAASGLPTWWIQKSNSFGPLGVSATTRARHTHYIQSGYQQSDSVLEPPKILDHEPRDLTNRVVRPRRNGQYEVQEVEVSISSRRPPGTGWSPNTSSV